MIKLDIQPYCQDCDLMQPIAERKISTYWDETTTCETFVRCEMKHACMRKIEQLRKEVDSYDNTRTNAR